MQHVQISLGIKFQFKQTVLNFCTKSGEKGYIQFKTEKLNIPIKGSLCTTFQLKQTVLIFESNLAKKIFLI